MPRRKSQRTAVKRVLEFEENKENESKRKRIKMSEKAPKVQKKNSIKGKTKDSDENLPIKEKTKTQKANKVDLFDKKCGEFKTLIEESPDVAKLISDNKLTIGAHISVAGAIYNGLINAYKIKATAMAFFVTPPRKWTLNKVLTDEEVSIFNEGIKILGYKLENILPHGNYLVNLGSPDETVYNKSYACFECELKLCEQLQVPWLNIHPGSAVKGFDKAKCLQQIGESINKAHKATYSVTVVLENMCKQGTTVGGDLSDLGTIISHVTDKTRIGVCIDTCHAMAAGYDLSTSDGIEAMFVELDQVVGMQYLKAFHLNDKKGHCDDHLDRHEVLGQGCIKFPVFKYLVEKFPNIPMVLETPDESRWAEELIMLRKLSVVK